MAAKKYLPALAFLLVGLAMLAKPVADMDEIWNFSFASYICDGMLPYSDFNMLQTPLSAYLAACFLRLFGNELLVHRFLGILLFAATFWLLYLLCQKLSNSALAFVAASFSAALCTLVWMYNYNHLNLLLLLAIMYLECGTTTRGPRSELVLQLVIGLLCGATVVIKQSTGAVLLVYNAAVCAYKFVTHRSAGKRYAARLVVSVIPGAFFLLQLAVTGSLADFWDYAVLGVQTFTHRSRWIDFLLSDPLNFLLAAFPLAASVLTVVTVLKGNSGISREKHILLLILAWAGSVVAYPLCDFIHATVAAVPFVIPLLCCGNLRISKRDGVVCAGVAIVLLCCCGLMSVKNLPRYKTCGLRHFCGLPVDAQIEHQLKTVGDYVLQLEQDGTAVIVADQNAAAYMLPIDRYYKDFGLLLVGNVGTKTVEELLQYDRAVYLVVENEDQLGMQAHKELIMYIKKNYSKVGTVAGFEAYAKK